MSRGSPDGTGSTRAWRATGQPVFQPAPLPSPGSAPVKTSPARPPISYWPHFNLVSLAAAGFFLGAACSAEESSPPGGDTSGQPTTPTTSVVTPTSAMPTSSSPGPSASSTTATNTTTGATSSTSSGMTGSVAPTTSPTPAPNSDSSATSGPAASTGSSAPASDDESSETNESTTPAETSDSPTSSGGQDTGASDEPVPSAGCGKTRTLQDGDRMINSGGTNRAYYLKTPANYDSERPYRLIFMFHWFYGSIDAVVNPPDADRNTDDPFYGLGDLAGDSSIFVVPQGLSDLGGAGWSNPNNRDVNFTDDMLAQVTDDLCVDTSRVFTTGFSFGGAISYKLACVRPDKFRAAVVYGTGPISGNNAAECTNPIAFLGVHGVDDGTFNYVSDGLSVLDIFVGTNGCTDQTPPMPGQNEHTCTSFQGCAEGYPVRFCGFGAGQNNPHNASLRGHYPSPKDPGQAKSWVPTEAWEFIQQF